MVHEQIKKFLESNGLEVVLDLEQDKHSVESARFSDSVAKAFVNSELYDRVYEDILGLDLGNKITIKDFFHQVDRTAEGLYITLALNKTDSMVEDMAFNEDYFGGSWIRYELMMKSNQYENVDTFLKSYDFMTKTYVSFENLFRKTLDASGELGLIEEKSDRREKGGYITRSFSEEAHPEEKIQVFNHGNGIYFLHLEFLLDKRNRKEIFDAIKEARNIFNQYSD
ncbi:MAG: hypothetical protein ACP5N2_01255 [Candidatus Nanoarchaeia archaeon]